MVNFSWKVLGSEIVWLRQQGKHFGMVTLDSLSSYGTVSWENSFQIVFVSIHANNAIGTIQASALRTVLSFVRPWKDHPYLHHLHFQSNDQEHLASLFEGFRHSAEGCRSARQRSFNIALHTDIEVSSNSQQEPRTPAATIMFITHQSTIASRVSGTNSLALCGRRR